MTQSNNVVPERKLRHQTSARITSGATADAADTVTPIEHTDASVKQTAPAGDRNKDAVLDPESPVLRALHIGISPLHLWRTLPADAFRAGDYLQICSALDEIATVLEGSDAVPALYGDGDTAIGIVLGGMPIRSVGLRADIAMTAVARCALEGDLRAALVLYHILKHAELDRRRASALSASWFAFYLRHSPGKRGFTPDEKIVLRELHACQTATPWYTGEGGRA